MVRQNFRKKKFLDKIVTTAPFCSFLLLFFLGYDNAYFYYFLKALRFDDFTKKNEIFVTIIFENLKKSRKKEQNCLIFLKKTMA
jgi:hypothetical protein